MAALDPITAEQMKLYSYKLTDDQTKIFSEAINEAEDDGDITTALRRCHFLAQTAHESAGYKRMSESFAYHDPIWMMHVFKSRIPSLRDARLLIERGQEAIANRVYANRYGNGDEASGDGWRYRGRGLIGLTFKNNYARIGNAVGIDLLNNPELLDDPKVAAKAAAGYWDWRNCNIPADEDDIKTVTMKINPSLEGMDGRTNWLSKAKKIFLNG